MTPRVRGLALCLAVLLPAGAWATPQPPHIVRMQAGTLDASGWTPAVSTGGGFAIRMPCLFNDFSIEDDDLQSLVSITHGLGCRRPDGMRFTAMRIRYRNGATSAQTMFDSLVTDQWPAGTAIRPARFAGAQALDISGAMNGTCGWTRFVRDGGDTVMVGVEAPQASGPCDVMPRIVSEYFAGLEFRPVGVQ